MMQNKFAENVEMSLSVPEEELKLAKVAVDLLKLLVQRIENFDSYLDNLYNPFKDHQTVSKESVSKYRGALWRYSEEIEKDFGKDEDNAKKMADWSIKKIALVCANKLQTFSSDTQIANLLQTFSDDISNVEDNVENLIEAIRNTDSAQFKDSIIKTMESLKKELNELIKIIEERIIDYINTNILAKNWIEDSGEDYNIKPQNREPYVVRLYKERAERLNQR